MHELPDREGANIVTMQLTREAIIDLGWTGRDFLRETDFVAAELDALITLAGALKAAKRARQEPQFLHQRNVALIFEKTSTRTRCAFEVGAADQGAHTTFIDPTSSQLGHKESVSDTAAVLTRFFDAIEFRGAQQSTVQELADVATVPVYNGLTDDWHPTQSLADFLTMAEHAQPSTWSDISYAYVGDARYNMANSLLAMGAVMGSDVRICAPAELLPSPRIVAVAQQKAAQSGARITITTDPAEALAGAQFVHTDVWVSMGEAESAWSQRVDVLRPYRVDAHLMALTERDDAKFMHCLPAFHDSSTGVGALAARLSGIADGIEVSDEVFRSDASIVFDQAENRLHTIKALLVATLAGS